MTSAKLIFRSFLVAVGTGFCGLDFVLAQEPSAPSDKPPLPAGPLLRSWEPRESWTIDFEYKNPPPAASAGDSGEESPDVRKPGFSDNAPPSVVSITRFEPFYTMRYVGRSPSDLIRYFVLEDAFFVQAPPKNTTTRGIHPALLDPEAQSFAQKVLLAALAGAFIGFEWISPDNYVGVEDVEGVPCFVFKNEETTAWIDSEKRQPVMWQRGGETRRFALEAPPTKHDVPQDVLQRIRGIMEDRDALRRRNT